MKEKASFYRYWHRGWRAFSEWQPGRQMVWSGVILSLFLFWGAVAWLMIDWMLE